MTGFSNRVALVTGAGSGIGAACVNILASRGAMVVGVDLHQFDPISVARDNAANVVSIAADVRSESDCNTMVAFALERFGRLDIAVNSAGTGEREAASAGNLTMEEWRRVLGVNLDGTFLSLRSEIRAMRLSGGGSIINIASILGTVATPGHSAYVASKHAVVGLTKAAALDHALENIRVNAVCPAFTETPPIARFTPEQRAQIISQHPIGRFALPEEVASTVVHLASDEATYITGSYIPIDGGYLAK